MTTRAKDFLDKVRLNEKKIQLDIKDFPDPETTSKEISRGMSKVRDAMGMLTNSAPGGADIYALNRLMMKVETDLQNSMIKNVFNPLYALRKGK